MHLFKKNTLEEYHPAADADADSKDKQQDKDLTPPPVKINVG